MRVAGQVLVSALLVTAVLVFMWRLPRRGEALAGWAPPLALVSAWTGLLAGAISAALWLLPFPDRWLAAALLFFDPASIACGTLVLWIHRGVEAGPPAVDAQRTQARVGIVLGIAAVVLGYAYVMTHKTPFTPVGL
jgi:hypothetical protein